MAMCEAAVICAGGTWMTTGQMRYTGNGAGLEVMREENNEKKKRDSSQDRTRGRKEGRKGRRKKREREREG